MASLGFHITLRLRDDRPLAVDDDERRTLARAVLEIGEAYGLFAFAAVDTHLHLAVACERDRAGRFCQALTLALAARLQLGASFEPARIRPFRDQWHRQNTLFYILRQSEHHGVSGDPFFEATNLPDPLELRVLGGYTRHRVAALLPRVTNTHLAALLGSPLDERVVPALLLPATLAATGLVRLEGQGRAVSDARTAALAVCPGSDLGVSIRARQRAAARDADPTLVRAIRLQMGLRDGTRLRPSSPPIEVNAEVARS